MNPKASRAATVVSRTGTAVTFQHDDAEDSVAVDAFAARVWELADGTRPVAAIVRALAEERPGTTAQQVWSALDLLSDCGLLARRIAPPAGAAPTLPRREAIRRGAALAAGAASFVIAGAIDSGATYAQSEEAAKEADTKAHGQQTEEQAKQNAEHDHKHSQEQAVKIQAEADQKSAGGDGTTVAVPEPATAALFGAGAAAVAVYRVVRGRRGESGSPDGGESA